ncbi:Putative LOC101234561, partial [Caligus rogercresseyi]
TIMVNMCCAPGCKQGYKSTPKDPSVTFHTFPKKDSILSDSRICSLHFLHSDFVTASEDPTRNIGRTLQKRYGLILACFLYFLLIELLLISRRLKDGVIPSKWPNLPTYLSSKRQLPRPTQAATTSKRSVLINERQEALRKELSMKESVKTAQELYHKLTSETLPSGFTLLQLPKVSLVKMVSTENGMDISLSLEVDEDLSFQMYHRHSLLEKSLVSHCMTSIKKIRSITEALNIAAYLGSRDQLPDKEMFEDIRARLERYINSAELEEVHYSKLSFIFEQMNLLFKPRSGRRYSPGLLSSCLMWQNINSGLYEQLHSSNAMSLPSPRYLRSIACSVTVEAGLSSSTIRYLQSRIQDLCTREKNVTLIIDEVYSAQRIEFVRGKFLGNENNQATKTVLTFMIKSAGGKYMDVVALVPVVKLTAELLFNQYTRIMKTLWEIDFTVVALSVDNHTVNRRFYTQFLCEDNLQTWIPHPHDSSKRVHLLIDSVHNFKNIYNCFQRKDYLECPNIFFPDSPPLRPNFAHIREVHKIESTFKVRLAHKLSLKVLNPTSIEKTNVKLADATFHESTIGALKFYSKDKPAFLETAEFAEFVRNYWNVVNIKTPQEWQKSGLRGLTDETFLATKHTSLALADLIEYVLEDDNFVYVLPSMFQSDPIEKRFGWYRQLSGGNYFISVRQILEAEKKIRVLSLVKYSNMEFSRVKELLSEDQVFENMETKWMPSDLESITTEGECNALYFVAGFIAYSITKKYRAHLVNVIRLEAESDEEKVELGRFTKIMSRGGLSTPSDMTFLTCVHAYSLLYFISTHDDEKVCLLRSSNPRATFTGTFVEKMFDSTEVVIKTMLNSQCEKGHKWGGHLKKICQIIFNVSSKNLVAQLNDEIHDQSRKRAANKLNLKERKIAKLLSKA